MARTTVFTRFLVLVLAGLAVVASPAVADDPSRPTTVVPLVAPAAP